MFISKLCFRICSDTGISLWCCWFKTNLWARTSYWVAYSITIIVFSKLVSSEGLLWFCNVSFSVMSSVLPLNWTVGMVGILAGSIEDAFIVSVLDILIYYVFFFSLEPFERMWFIQFYYLQLCSYEWWTSTTSINNIGENYFRKNFQVFVIFLETYLSSSSS